jgi:2-iminobutanoate/2-iminopropanoate deaminase
MTIRHIEPTKAFHRVVAHGNTAYLAGIVADNGSAPIDVQVNQVIDNLAHNLELAGSSLNDVLSVTIFLTDMSHKRAMTEIWRQRFPEHRLPARATIGVSDLDGPYLIEITAIAACGT